jgi:redox-sensitive bicupin YhaK (pirin superfamily)
VYHAESIGADQLAEGRTGEFRSVLFWVNLARKDKGAEPTAQVVAPDELPSRTEGGAIVRTLVGPGSPVELGTPGLILDVELPEGGSFDTPIPTEFNAFVWMLEGEASVGCERAVRPPVADRGARPRERTERHERSGRDAVHADGGAPLWRSSLQLQRTIRGLMPGIAMARTHSLDLVAST